MKWSTYYYPTLKEEPSDAEIQSHKLMIRAGLMRKLTSGAYIYLPAGMRVLNKVNRIIREEMNRKGALEVLMPVLQPEDIWERTGRLEAYGELMFRFKDRHGRGVLLGPTHEEVITSLVSRNINSYKQLPVNFYQIQTKFRDEFRPRFGVLRSREFIMKDAYSFNESPESLEKSYQDMYDAYGRIFKRCGLDFVIVEADSGDIGGDVSHEFMVPSPKGEDHVVMCKSCDYAVSLERAEVRCEDNKPLSEKEEELKEADTPGASTIEQVTAFFEIGPEKLVKSLIYSYDDGEAMVLLRGDFDVNETKLNKILPGAVLASEETVEQISGAPVGFAGPVGMKKKVKIFADYSVKAMGGFITGANKNEKHMTGITIGRDFAVDEYHDLRYITPEDPCPRCAKEVKLIHCIEVGHIFKLGIKYSEPLGAMFQDVDGKLNPIIMGCYGIGVNRIIAAQIETSSDDSGIIWKGEIAPFDVLITALNYGKNQEVKKESDAIYNKLCSKGIDVLLDDRNERPGSKFKDADLIGLPLRITVGAKGLQAGTVEVKERRRNNKQDVALSDVITVVEDKVHELKS